jgi:uncharacterized protein YndB with AHSA1/START domain
LSDRVDAPIERVFALLSDPARMPEWLPGCSAGEAGGPLQRGAHFKVRFGTRLAEFEVVEFAPPKTLSWVERHERTGAKLFFQLDFVGGSTAITIRDEWAPHSLAAWVQSRSRPKRDVPHHLRAILENLQRLLSS